MKFLLSMFLLLMVSLSAWLPSTAKADTSCSATVFLRDYADGFRTNIEAFDFCFARVKWWKLDQGEGWKERYCRLSQYSNNGYRYFSILFYQKDRVYSNVQYTDSIFYALNDDYADRVGKGWPANLEIQFSPNCSRY